MTSNLTSPGSLSICLIISCQRERCTQISISEVSALVCVDLRVRVEVSDPLDVHHNQLVARPLKGEVTEGLTDRKGTSDDDYVSDY